MKAILKNYSNISGQLVKYHKFMIQFSKKLKIGNTCYHGHCLGTISNSIGRYLGCRNVDHKRARRDLFK